MLAGIGSALAELVVPVKLIAPELGVVKLMLQTIDAPSASEDTGDAGAQETLAPGGRPAGKQVALTAVLGPLLVQVRVPTTWLPAAGFAGKPLKTALMSD